MRQQSGAVFKRWFARFIAKCWSEESRKSLAGLSLLILAAELRHFIGSLTGKGVVFERFGSSNKTSGESASSDSDLQTAGVVRSYDRNMGWTSPEDRKLFHQFLKSTQNGGIADSIRRPKPWWSSRRTSASASRNFGIILADYNESSRPTRYRIPTKSGRKPQESDHQTRVVSGWVADRIGQYGPNELHLGNVRRKCAH